MCPLFVHPVSEGTFSPRRGKSMGKMFYSCITSAQCRGLGRINNSPEHVWTGTEIIPQQSESGYTLPPLHAGFRTSLKCREASKHITQSRWNIKGYWLAWECALECLLCWYKQVNRLRYLTLVNIAWECVLAEGQVSRSFRLTVSITLKQHFFYFYLIRHDFLCVHGVPRLSCAWDLYRHTVNQIYTHTYTRLHSAKGYSLVTAILWQA